MKFKFILLLAFSTLFGAAFAQDKLNIKFGKVVPEDFDLSKSSYDTGAAAVIIADIGNTSFEGNRRGRDAFTMVYKRFKRIKIIKRAAFDLATYSIRVFSNGVTEESLDDLKASVYNLQGGKVVETKLDSKSVFVDKLSKYRSNKKFTLPAVQEGSIIEVSYTIKSDFIQFLRGWEFQGDYPCLWSEYEVHIPNFFHYVSLLHGDESFIIKTSKDEVSDYTIRVSGGAESSDDVTHINGTNTVNRWVKKDVPALKEEVFTTTTENYLSRIEFQLHYVQYDVSSPRHDYLGNWYMACEKLMDDEDFGASLSKDISWTGQDIKPLVAKAGNNLEKIRLAYEFVRDHYTCTNHDAIFTSKSLRNVYKSRSGNVADINILLVAMLRNENIDADPAILSTRDNGFVNDAYPLIENYNYVVCVAKDENKTYYLDASLPGLGFGRLSIDCYNGSVRTINKEKPFLANFDSDSLVEKSLSAVLIINDEKGRPSGSVENTMGYYDSYALREEISKGTIEKYFKNLQTKSGSSFQLENTSIDSLKKPDFPVKVHYDFNMSLGESSIIYFNPMLFDQLHDNPFKSADRKYPVEMPFKIDDTYILSMELPVGYTVEEIPKSARVTYNESEGMFEYIIQQTSTGIQLRSRIKLNKSKFPPDEYNTLRDFYAFIVKKQSEQIVFKKQK